MQAGRADHAVHGHAHTACGIAMDIGCFGFRSMIARDHVGAVQVNGIGIIFAPRIARFVDCRRFDLSTLLKIEAVPSP